MYYLLLILLYPLSLLPLQLLYLLSDALYLLLFYVTGYRKQLVWENLKHAFPEKTDAEIAHIRQRFYRSFCDQWIETLKLLSVSTKELNRRVAGNWEVFRQLEREGKNVYVLLGHTFNWEWANVACQHNAQQQFAGVYLPLTSRPFDRLMQRIRSRGGGWLISMKALKAGLQRVRPVRHIIAMMADQNPSVAEVALWLPFLNREAPFFRGPGQMAVRANGAVVFAGISRIKRGYYRVTLERITDHAGDMAPEEITRRYVSFMERQIRTQPENWLWSHNRWKYRRKS